MHKAESINSFYGRYRFLSNFYPITMKYGGRMWRTAEHAYQGAKTLQPREKTIIQDCSSPGRAKRAGNKCTLRDDWEIVKVEIMEEIVRIKFEDPDLAAALIRTGTASLTEGNNWGDTFWGICNGAGRNVLGIILMDRRDALIVG